MLNLGQVKNKYNNLYNSCDKVNEFLPAAVNGQTTSQI